MRTSFASFLDRYPPEADTPESVDHESLSAAIKLEFGVTVPTLLQAFWREIGCGYFGHRQLCFFGDSTHFKTRDSILDWNRQEFWGDLFDPPSKGGPFFFAENCFGDQLGFRYCKKTALAVLFVVDLAKVYVVGEPFDRLFSSTFDDPYALVEEKILRVVKKKLGSLPDGKHYAPLVSPLFGGSAKATNFHFESPDVHLLTAIANYKAQSRM